VSSPQKQENYADFWHPRYWITWLGFCTAWLITRLPYRLQLQIGSSIGRIGYHLANSRRHIVEVNISLCFPALPPEEQDQLVRKVFRSSGISIVETANAWLRNPRDFLPRVSITGLHHLENTLKQGNGVLLLGMHFSTLDLCGAVLATYVEFDVMYRRNKNRLLDLIMKKGRQKNFPKAINRNDIRGILNSLKQGHAVWYGADQDYGRKHSVFAPFFGIQAASITATGRFASMTQSPLILFTHFRNEGGSYRIELSEPIADFPSGDEVADASFINQLVEQAVLKQPDQYWWLHRRFKTRPEGESRPY
jgi:KDO2-lipid IV(A) lauroyltransferase|tara:strand:- start:260 stop:1180 length:921 start_codon:yes stop_codon:yes gene_type:complete